MQKHLMVWLVLMVFTTHLFASEIHLLPLPQKVVFSSSQFVVAEAEYEFGVDGGELEFDIQTNVDIKVTISDNAINWIQQVNTRGLETKTLNFLIAACSSDESREGTITISGGNATQNIKVKQTAYKVEIDAEAVPDDEIWYITSDNQVYDINQGAEFYGLPQK